MRRKGQVMMRRMRILMKRAPRVKRVKKRMEPQVSRHPEEDA